MKKYFVLFCSLLCIGIGVTNAQYTDLYDITNLIPGNSPFGSFTVSGNMMYGMTNLGYMGSVFSIRTDGSGYKDLYTFNGNPDGQNPYGDLLLSGNTLYGMTTYGGTSGEGMLFSIQTNGTGYHTLFNFSYTHNPAADLTLLNGKFFGTTSSGGNFGDGSIFSIDTTGANYTDLFYFNGTNGDNPYSTLVFSGSQFFGMTVAGGTKNFGTVFSIDTTGANYKKLFDFDSLHGLNPLGSLILSGYKLYGLTTAGGAHNAGTIFSIDTNGGGYKDMFDFIGTTGSYPQYTKLTLTPSGKLYGMTANGGQYNDGVIFKIDTSGNNYADVYNFYGIHFPFPTNGAIPCGSLTLSGNILYGMSKEGGHDNLGQIFSFDTSVETLTAIRDSMCTGDTALLFAGGLNGATYSWSPGGATTDSIYVHPSTTSIYTVTSYQGLSKYQDSLSVVVIPLPTPVINGMSTVCAGHTENLIATGATTFLWSNGSTQNAYRTGPIDADSTFTVIGYNSFGCSDTAHFTITVDTNCASGIEAIQDANLLQVFPNPNNGIFTIQSSVVGHQLSVEVYNVLGEKVYSQLSIIHSQLLIDLSSQPNGVYLYRVLNEDGGLVGDGKLVIQK